MTWRFIFKSVRYFEGDCWKPNSSKFRVVSFNLKFKFNLFHALKKQIYNSEISVQNVNILMKIIGVWKGFTNFKSNSSKD